VWVLALLPIPAVATMTTEEERELGEKLARQLQQELEIIHDEVVQGYVEAVGDRVVKAASDFRFPYRFYLVREKQPNAFTIPGGHVFVTSGLIMMVDNEDELAGVIGHEISHSTLRHIAKALERGRAISLATLAAILAGAFISRDAKSASALTAGASAMAQSLMLQYSRENEFEADQRGTKIVVNAGYNPEGIVSFLRKMYRWQRMSSPDVPTYLSTHPGVDERMTFLTNTFLTQVDLPVSFSPHEGDLEKIQVRMWIKENGEAQGIDHFTSQVARKPGDVNSMYGLGTAYNQSGRFREAVPILEKARTLAPHDPHVLRELGISYFKLQVMPKAIEVLEETRQAFSKDTTVLYYLAQSYQEQGVWDRALSTYRSILALSPKRLEIYHDIGQLYSLMGDQASAHEYFGLYFLNKGQRDTALFHLRKALELQQSSAAKATLQQRINDLER